MELLPNSGKMEHSGGSRNLVSTSDIGTIFRCFLCGWLIFVSSCHLEQISLMSVNLACIIRIIHHATENIPSEFEFIHSKHALAQKSLQPKRSATVNKQLAIWRYNSFGHNTAIECHYVKPKIFSLKCNFLKG